MARDEFGTALAGSLRGIFPAIAQAPLIREQARLQSGLQAAQAGKAMQERDEALRLSGLRQDDTFINGVTALYGPEVAMAWRAGGDADKFGSNAMDAQKYRFRDRVLGNIGDPGTDQTRINMGTSVLEGKTYEPYAAVGDTGSVLNKGSGSMTLADPGLRAIFGEKAGSTGRQVVDTPTGIQIVNPRTGVAEPAVNPEGRPILGDKAHTKLSKDRERNQEIVQADSAFGTLNDSVSRLETAAADILGSEDLWRVTGAVGRLPSAPGFGAADLEARLQNLKSQVGFTVLQAMRDASKTGGALGAISDKENELLQNNLAALDTKQSPESFRVELQKIVDYTKGIRDRAHEAYQRTYGTAPSLPGSQAPATESAPARFPPVTVRAANALRANPDRANEFDAKYGPGAAVKILGR